MRLQRVGRKNDPSYRVVVTDSRTGPKSNKHVDLIGSYSTKMNKVQIDRDKVKGWISKGVQVSDTVHNILVGQKIIEGKKINVLPKKSPIVNEEKIAKEKEEAEKASVTEAETEVKQESSEVAEEDKAREEKKEIA